jgi:hypothetical protein
MHFHRTGRSCGTPAGCDLPAGAGRQLLALTGLGNPRPLLRRARAAGPLGRRGRSSARPAAVGALLLTFAVAAGASLAANRVEAAPGREDSAAQTPSHPSRARPVAFRAVDGSLLHGYSDGSGKRWLILVHNRGQNASAWSKLAPAFRQEGFKVLAFDLSRDDASRDSQQESRDPSDILAALRFARANGARSRYLIGAGSGATAALVAAGTSEVKALVLLSPRARLAGVPRDAIRLSRAPKLFIVGALDARAARQADDVFERSIGWALLRSLPVRAQGTELLATSWKDQILETILLFLRDYP